MANLRDPFAAYYAPSANAITATLQTGLVALDTNVLLAAYRFERQAREELFGAFKKLEDRLWIPFQVALEFHRNRLGVIAEQEEFFGKTRADLEAPITTYIDKLRTFTNRISLPQACVQALEQAIRDAHTRVLDQVASAERGNEVHLKGRDSDEVLSRLEALFDGRVGEPMQPDVLKTALNEARRRVTERIPPGYEDKDKADASGDYLLWKQLLLEAAKRQVPVVLVTDERKPDWVRKERGQTIGPRPELYEEMSSEAGVPFQLMSTATFLRYMKTHLNIPVSPKTEEQAKELPAVLSERQRASRGAQVSDLDQLRRMFNENQQELGGTDELVRRLRDREVALARRMRGGSGDDSADAEELGLLRPRLAEAEQKMAALAQEREELDNLGRALELEVRVRGDLRTPVEQEYYQYLVARLTDATRRRESGELQAWLEVFAATKCSSRIALHRPQPTLIGR